MHATFRAHACAWVDQATHAPCPVEIPAYRLHMETTATTLHLPLCAERLAGAVVASFAAYGAEALYIQRARRS